MIIIAGDSWGCGEWDQMEVTHGGLGEYLCRDYKVVNLSVGGASPMVILQNLNVFFKSGCVKLLNEPIEYVFVFQTEWHRDFLFENPYDFKDRKYDFLDFTLDLPHNRVSWFYYRLVDIAKKYSLRIGLIGGAADTLWLSKFEQEYPGLYIACQSMTNLLVNDDHRVTEPIYGLYKNRLLIEQLKKSANKKIDNINEWILEQIELSEQRIQTWKSNPKWFYPDEVHGNRVGHRKLYEFLKDSVIDIKSI